MDAVLNMNVSAGGSISSSTQITVETMLSYTCDGADCETVAEMFAAEGAVIPCESKWSQEAEFVGSKE